MSYQYPFLDPSLPLKERVLDLVSRLTLEEKTGFIPTRNHAVERLGIAEWSIGGEGAHGFVNREGQNTTFPQTIGLAAGWDRELLRKIGEVAATEARAYYAMNERKRGLSIWAPTIDLERDPRWGRTEEGYGEDPFLTSELSSAYIRGAQGDDPFYLRASCGPKHFFANNNEKDRGICSCSIPSRCLHEYYLVPFKNAIQKAKAASLMTAYNEVNGIPMMLHPILNDIVKNEWGLDGHIVTDGGDFLQTVKMHHYFESHAETLAAALRNGGDSMTDNPDVIIAATKEALEKKLIDEAELDKHLERIFAVRFRLGHFDPPGRCPYDAIGMYPETNTLPKQHTPSLQGGVVDCMKSEYRSLAREAVRKSAVLLKNEGGLLPLKPGAIKGPIAVTGPLADAVLLDWYSGHPPYACAPLEGLKELYGEDRILYTDCRDIVSFAAEDGRPLVLADIGNGGKKVLSVGNSGEAASRFYREDWGWGACTFTDVESGLMLEVPFLHQEQHAAANFAETQVIAGAKNNLNWFVVTLFSSLPQEGCLFLLRTWDKRHFAAPDAAGPVLLRDDPPAGQGELFNIKIERDGLAAAASAAEKAEQIIFIGGNDPMINGREEMDRPSLNLPPRQEELIRRIAAVNPKTALILISGYPYTCTDIAARVPAILWMAHGIQETGHGLADIVGSVHSPAGRLSQTWYEDEKQLPSIMEYDIIAANTTYQYFPGKVQFPFGHGLSYSNFTYSDLIIDKTAAGEDETVTISFKLKNTGSVEAEEVPQMYVTFSGSAFRRPLRTLKGFTRLSLKPGKDQIIRFSLPVRELAVWESFEGRFCTEAGYCTVVVGASSADIRLSGGFEVRGEHTLPRNMTGPVYAERFDDYADCFLHEKRGSGIPSVFNKNDGGWIRFAALDFGSPDSPKAGLSATVQGAAGSYIEIRLDAPDGVLAGTIAVPNTGDFTHSPFEQNSPRRRPAWAFAETSTEKIYGVHDLYLVLYGKTGIWRFACTA
jgi:beta-glucosidase